MACGEFDLIRRFFDRQPYYRRDVELGIGDDCALMTVAEKQQVAVSSYTLVSSIQFLLYVSASVLAWKTLAVNLNELAAIGSDPAWVSLAVTLSSIYEAWLGEFSDSF